MKKFAVLSLCLLLCAALVSCGSSSADFAGETFNKSASAPTTDSALGLYGASAEVAEDFSYTATGMEQPDGALREEKLVYTANVTLETEDFDAASDALHKKIESLGGIVVSESAYNLNRETYRGSRSMDMTVRIPQENYDAFLTGLGDICNVAGIRRYVENLTEQYYDNETRLKAYRIQEERLLSMLESAKTVSEMLEIESRLCDVQYQIESLTNTQRTIDNDVRYATFNLTLSEVTKYTTPAPKTFGDRLGETLKDSGETFVNVAEGLLFFAIYVLPYLLCIAVVVAIVLICVKCSKKRKVRKTKSQDE